MNYTEMDFAPKDYLRQNGGVAKAVLWTLGGLAALGFTVLGGLSINQGIQYKKMQWQKEKEIQKQVEEAPEVAYMIKKGDSLTNLCRSECGAAGLDLDFCVPECRDRAGKKNNVIRGNGHNGGMPNEISEYKLPIGEFLFFPDLNKDGKVGGR